MRPPLIVSMTAISPRLSTLTSVVESLLGQTLAPDRLMLNISTDAYLQDGGVRFETLPARLRRYAVKGDVELYFGRNSGPYRKILPTLQRLGGVDALVVTADDDVRYPPSWLSGLVECALAHDCVAAYRCRRMLIHDEAFAPYQSWPLLTSAGDYRRRGIDPDLPSRWLFPTGRDGVAYRAGHLDLPTLQALRALAPMQDDVALKISTLLKKIPVVRAPRERTEEPDGVEFTGLSMQGALFATNATGSNDEALRAVAQWLRPRVGDLSRLFAD